MAAFAHKPIAGHFFGTVVLEQTPVSIVNLPRREVIDGQQRLTTLQILLKAAEHALAVVAETSTDAEEAMLVRRASEQLAFLTRNMATSTDEESFKVWPTNEDRLPFQAVMNTGARVGVTGQTTRMAEAYTYFRETFIKWLTGANVANRAQALASGLKDHLRLIVLDLDETDEPQAIFETLNAHGTPLLPADLMKNWILWEATKQKLPVAALYEEYWRPFDRDAGYWREKNLFAIDQLGSVIFRPGEPERPYLATAHQGSRDFGFISSVNVRSARSMPSSSASLNVGEAIFISFSKVRRFSTSPAFPVWWNQIFGAIVSWRSGPSRCFFTRGFRSRSITPLAMI